MTGKWWIDSIGLSAEPRIGTPSFLRACDGIPDWVAFLLWAGWWMRSHARPDCRLHLVVLLPARSCCAAITALGACLASAREDIDGLTYPELMALAEGTRVSLHIDGKTMAGTIGSIESLGGQPARKVTLNTNLKRYRNSTFWLHEQNLYQASTDQKREIGTQRQAVLQRVEQFYKSVDRFSKPGWPQSGRKEVLVATSKAAWKRDVVDVVGQVSGGGSSLEIVLRDLLVETDNPQGWPGKTLLISQAGQMNDLPEVHLAVLDGPDAVRRAREVQANTVVMLVEHREYDETVEPEIAMMAEYCENEVIPEDVPDQLPVGIQASVFGWRKPQ